MLTAATSEAYLSGEVSKKGMVAAGVLSLVGNAAAMKNLSASKSKVPHVEHPTTLKGSNAEILPKKSTPILDKSVKHIDVDGNLGVANSSGVYIKTTKKNAFISFASKILSTLPFEASLLFTASKIA